MFSFQGASWISKRLNEASSFNGTSVNLFKMWWRLAGSNRWPPACKAGALPAELNPHILFLCIWEVVGQRLAFLRKSHGGYNMPPACCQEPPFESILARTFCSFLEVVGQNGLEPSTSRLSVVCSSQLSYWPISTSHFLGTFSPAPSKLNNVIQIWTLCTDLRTLQVKSPFYLKSP